MSPRCNECEMLMLTSKRRDVVNENDAGSRTVQSFVTWVS